MRRSIKFGGGKKHSHTPSASQIVASAATSPILNSAFRQHACWPNLGQEAMVEMEEPPIALEKEMASRLVPSHNGSVRSPGLNIMHKTGFDLEGNTFWEFRDQ